MALVGANATRLALGLNRAAGTNTSQVRAAVQAQTGARFNYYASEASVSGVTSKSGVPNGTRHPIAWLPPRTAGGLSSTRGETFGIEAGTLNLAEGRNIEGATTITIDVGAASLELVVSASGSATLTITVGNASLAGTVEASGSASVTLEMSAATLGAIADLTASASLAVDASGTATAIGYMEADLSPATLTADSIAAAVWAALSVENDVAGTMGRLLNSAGGAVDPDAIALAVWQYVTRTVDVTKVNGVTVDGTGTSGDPWGPA